MTAEGATPSFRFHAADDNDVGGGHDDHSAHTPTSEYTKPDEGGVQTAPAPSSVATRPFMLSKTVLYNPTPPSSPNVGRSNIRARHVKKEVEVETANLSVFIQSDIVSSPKDPLTECENPPMLCLKPLNVSVLKTTPAMRTETSTCAVQCDSNLNDAEKDQIDLHNHLSKGEYSDDFEDSDDEEFDGGSDFDMDERLYAELAFGVEIEPGDLDLSGGDLGLHLADDSRTGEGADANFSLEIVGQKMPVAEAWAEEPSTTPSNGETIAKTNLQATKSKTHKYLIEHKLGPNVFMMKDLAEEKKNQFKVLRRVPVRDNDPDYLVSSTRALQSQLKHDYLVAVDDVALEEGSVSITQQYCEGGTLHSLILRARSYGEILNEIEILDWFVQCLLALEHLHSQSINHQDVTTSNIYLKNNCVKLGAPMCFKRIYRKLKEIPNKKLHYMSPEVVNGGEISQASDMWSLGCVLYELCALKRLFRGKGRSQITTNISGSGGAGQLPAFPSGYTEHLGDIWRSLVTYEPEERPTASHVLQLPFIAEHLKDMSESLQHWKGDDSFGENTNHTPPGGWSDPDVDEDCFLTEEDAKLLLGY